MTTRFVIPSAIRSSPAIAPTRKAIEALRKRLEIPELWVNLGDDGLREAAYRGG
jgi:hypothetical protein